MWLGAVTGFSILTEAGMESEYTIYCASSKGREPSQAEQAVPWLLLEKLRDFDGADEAREVVFSIATAIWCDRDMTDD